MKYVFGKVFNYIVIYFFYILFIYIGGNIKVIFYIGIRLFLGRQNCNYQSLYYVMQVLENVQDLVMVLILGKVFIICRLVSYFSFVSYFGLYLSFMYK